MYKFLCSLCLLFITISFAAEDTYVFEAKGKFAKEMKALVEKYSKAGKIDVKVYKKDSSVMDSLFSKSTTNLDGQKIYESKCSSCHGLKGEKKPSADAKKLNTMTREEIETSIRKYKNDDHFGGFNKSQMQRVVINLTNKEINPIINYLLHKNSSAKMENSTQIEQKKEPTSSYLQ